MIDIKNISGTAPFKKLAKAYNEATINSQSNIQAACISSYDKVSEIVDSRFVNIKKIIDEDLIFYTNYNSPKAKQFSTHDQVSILFFWDSINLQIRFKSQIKKISIKYNQEYFSQRKKDKNALAISSNQSKVISSYNKVLTNYKKALASSDLDQCPSYWGGYTLKPFQIEFWQGNKSRLNKRDLYTKTDHNHKWNHNILEP